MTRRYDWTTRDGRQALDAAVLEAVGGGAATRFEVMVTLGLDAGNSRAQKATTAALGRLVALDKIKAEGDLGKRRYTATKEGT